MVTRKTAAKRGAAAKTGQRVPARTVVRAAAAGARIDALVAEIVGKTLAAPQRAAAVRRLSWEGLAASPKAYRELLKALMDPQSPKSVRRSLLLEVKSALFGPARQAPLFADTMTALRAMRTDPDDEIRLEVNGMLAREGDAAGLTGLVDGLRAPDQAVVPPEVALRLLSSAVHAGAFEAAKEVLKKPPSEQAQVEALRILAADGTEAARFEKLFLDRNASVQLRTMAAAALNQFDSLKFQDMARRVALDAAEHDTVRVLGLNAIATFGKRERLSADSQLTELVNKSKAGRSPLSEAARRLSAKLE